jgi:hypothetical protein
MDKNNTNEIKEILKVHGWLTVSKFGQEADQNAWLLVQHADHDPEFQASIAFLLEQLVPIGETTPSNFAYLADRVAVKYQHLGLKQKFGTQAIIIEGKAELEPFQGTLKDLNIRRKKMGLCSIEENMENLRKLYKTK